MILKHQQQIDINQMRTLPCHAYEIQTIDTVYREFFVIVQDGRQSCRISNWRWREMRAEQAKGKKWWIYIDRDIDTINNNHICIAWLKSHVAYIEIPVHINAPANRGKIPFVFIGNERNSSCHTHTHILCIGNESECERRSWEFYVQLIRC